MDKAQEYKGMMEEDKGGFTEEAMNKFMEKYKTLMAKNEGTATRVNGFIEWAKQNKIDPNGKKDINTSWFEYWKKQNRPEFVKTESNWKPSKASSSDNRMLPQMVHDAIMKIKNRP